MRLPGGEVIKDPVRTKFGDIGDIVNALLDLFLPIAGIVLLLYLIWGGFDLLTSAGNPEGIKRGQTKITQAVIGFLIIYGSYWIAQLLEYVLGVTILG